MPILTLLPMAEVGVSNWNAVGAATPVLALQSDDAGATITNRHPFILTIELQMDPLPPDRRVVSVTARVSFADPQAPFGLPVTVAARLNGVDGVVALVQDPSAAFTTYTDLLPRPGGGAWSAADVNNATCLLFAQSVTTEISYLAWTVVVIVTGSISANQSGSYIDRAYLTSRAGWARADASRAAFVPTDTQGTTAAAGKAPGTPGGYYSWRRRYLQNTTWTPLRPIASER